MGGEKKLTNVLELSLSGVHFKDLINQFSQKVNFVVTGYIDVHFCYLFHFQQISYNPFCDLSSVCCIGVAISLVLLCFLSLFEAST